MFDDIIIDKRKETKENYKRDLKKRIEYILDCFKLEPDDEKTREHLTIILTKLLEGEKEQNNITNYIVNITEKNIKIEVNV